MADLISPLREAGLLQFGRFSTPNEWQPYRLSLELLASYPSVLQQIAETAAARVGAVDRLVCIAAALPFGVALSQLTAIPLVYSRGTNEAAVYDLVGAYDIGHPALLVDHQRDVSTHRRLIERVDRVGLHVTSIMVIVDEGLNTPTAGVDSLLYLPDAVETLFQTGHLSAALRETVLHWINRHRQD